MITIEPLRLSQYRQVAEWEWGPQPENTDWERYVADMNAPGWTHFAIYSHAEFVGCVSLEKIDQQTVAYHVVKAPHRIHPYALAQVLLKMAGELFGLGYTLLIAEIPLKKRAAIKLAIRCGMKEEKHHDSSIRYFTLRRDQLDNRRAN